MDSTTALLGTGTGGTIIGILYLIYKTLNHKKCKSNCCGKRLEASIDVGETIPETKPEIQITK
jgi:hypothetical protein